MHRNDKKLQVPYSKLNVLVKHYRQGINEQY